MNYFKNMGLTLFSEALLSSCAIVPPGHTSQAIFPDYAAQAIGERFDSAKIMALENRMQKFVTDGNVAGIATLLVQNGKVISHTQTGIRRASDRAPITQDTLYRIASMTKPVTGVALMQLYEAGKFSLDDPVSKFIPEFSNLRAIQRVDADGRYISEPLDRQPTMRELMSHTAGFAYGLFGNDPSNKAFAQQGVLTQPDAQSFIDLVTKVPLISQPGEQWYYSVAVDIQGVIVERLSGVSLGDYFQTHIFKPLGMNHTDFYVPHGNRDNVSDVFGYTPKSENLEPIETAFGVAFSSMLDKAGMDYGGFGLFSTLNDYARFCQMLANDGVLAGRRILKPETTTLMRTNVLKPNHTVSIPGAELMTDTDNLDFGLDFAIVRNQTNNGVGQGTYFWGGAFGTWFWIDPVNDLYFIGMIQRVGQNGPSVNFRTIARNHVYDALKPPS